MKIPAELHNSSWENAYLAHGKQSLFPVTATGVSAKRVRTPTGTAPRGTHPIAVRRGVSDRSFPLSRRLAYKGASLFALGGRAGIGDTQKGSPPSPASSVQQPSSP
ncbi:MAG: hypothetical protein KME57_23570 [Scytonema hyalinum WJT4-NPBG1]|jgi:hypothetical protein|nr:hypothetical protein [Scytonema hyalinum WJT4-NPBG1]